MNIFHRFKVFIHSTLQSEFVRNSIILFTGSTIAQAITILISPILTRQYSPSDFGVWSLYVSVASLFSVIATGRYELAIMLPKEDKQAVNLLSLSVYISIGLSAIILIFAIFFHDWTARVLNNTELSGYLIFTPATILLTGLFNSFNNWLTRKKRFRPLSTSRIAQSGFSAGTKIGMGFVGSGPLGLILGDLIGLAVSVVMLGRDVWMQLRQKLSWISKDEMIKQAKIHQDFPKINSLHAFVDIIQTSGTAFLISILFDSATLGLFSFAVRILRMPLYLIGTSISKVFYQKATTTYQTGGDLYGLVQNMVLKLVWISIPFFIITVLFAPPIFSFVFGPEWREAGVYTQLLSLWFFGNFIFSPVSDIPLLVNKQKSYLGLSLGYNISILVSLGICGILGYNAKVTFGFLSIVAIVWMSIIISWLLKISKLKDKRAYEI
ncbi:MAG: oligosaccharide flippase family protein [Candidatus Marinimicrobia bacterium]|nr:oligosaccharide flippase family protein [Candidatus Neomarinimicrobiota bacterium]